MSVQLTDFITMYALPCGRAVFAARQVLEVALALGVLIIAKRTEDFLQAADTAHDLELRYRTAKAQPQYGPQAMVLDGQVDGGLGTLDRALHVYDNLADNPAMDPELPKAANLLSTQLFPRGVSHITHMSYPEEHEAVGKLLVRLQGDLSAAVARLSLQPFVAILAASHKAFGAELQKRPKVEGPTWDQLRAARATLQTRATQLIATVLGTFADEDDESVAKRDTLLEPIMVQQRAMAALYKARRVAIDVNPETGELEAEVELAPQP